MTLGHAGDAQLRFVDVGARKLGAGSAGLCDGNVVGRNVATDSGVTADERTSNGLVLGGQHTAEVFEKDVGDDNRGLFVVRVVSLC